MAAHARAGQRPRRRRAPALIALALAAPLIAAALLLATSALWLGPALQHFVQSRTQRQLDVRSVRLGLTRALEPTVRLRGLRIANAPWADARPFVTADEVRFTFAWRSLSERRIVVSRLELDRAQVDLERQADGLRNWRLSNPDDRGPGRIKVVALDARDSRIRFVHRGIDVELDTAIAVLPVARTTPQAAGLPLTKRLDLSGRSAGQAFAGRFDVSDVLTFVESGASFAVQGEATSGRTRLQLDGRLADLATPGEIDARVALSGASLDELGVALRRPLPQSRAYRLQAHLRRAGVRTALTGIDARIGQTDLAGDAVHIVDARGTDDERSRYEAHLRSRSADWADFATMRPAGAGDAGAFDFASLQRVEARATLAIDALATPWPLHLRDLRLDATLAQGVLRLAPARLASAGGTIAGRATFDTRRDPPAAELAVDIDGLRLDRLLASQPENARVAGALRGHVELHAAGRTRAELLRSLDGRATASAAGASISSALDARLALNGGRMLRTLLEGAEQVPVRCIASDWRVHRGSLQAARLVMETDRVMLVGSGRIDLTDRSLALRFTPHRKQTALLALQRSIRVTGPFDNTKLALDEPQPLQPADGCLPTAHAAAAARE